MNANKVTEKGRTRTPSKKHNVENPRRSPRKSPRKKEESNEKGRRKLDFNKDKKQYKDRLKGIVVFVDVQNNASKQKEIKERIKAMGGKTEEFFDKRVKLVITTQKPVVEKPNGQTENSPLSARPSPSPQAVLSNKNSMKFSPYSTDSPQMSVEGGRRDSRSMSRSYSLMSKVLSNRKGAGSSNIWESAKNCGAKVISADEFVRKYMPKKSSTENNIKTLKDKSFSSNAKSSSTSSRTVVDVKVNKTTPPCFKIEDKTFSFRPVLHEFKEWPVIYYKTSLTQTPFDVPKVKSKVKLETPREQPSSNNNEDDTVSLAVKSDKMSEEEEIKERREKELENKKRYDNKKITVEGEKPGYCDCCSLRYKDLNKHIRSDHHRKFARDSNNFKHLDKLIDKGTNFLAFVNDLKTIAKLNELSKKASSTATATDTVSTISSHHIPLANHHLIASIGPSTETTTTNTIKQLPVPAIHSHCKFTSPIKRQDPTICSPFKDSHVKKGDPLMCSPIKHDSSVKKHLILSPRRSPRFNRHLPPAAVFHSDLPQLQTPTLMASPIKPDTAFSFPNVSTPAKLDTSTAVISTISLFPVVSTPAKLDRRTASVNNSPSRLCHIDNISPLDSSTRPISSILPPLENKGCISIKSINEEGKTEPVRTPDKPIRKVKRSKRRNSQRSSQASATGAPEEIATNEEEEEKETSCKILDESTPVDVLQRTNNSYYIMDKDDPEILFNTKQHPLLNEILLTPSRRLKSQAEPIDHHAMTAARIVHLCDDDEEKVDVSKNDTGLNETDILLKSFVDENFSNDEENDANVVEPKSEPCFLGYVDPETDDCAFCEIEKCDKDHIMKPATPIIESVQVDEKSELCFLDYVDPKTDDCAFGEIENCGKDHVTKPAAPILESVHIGEKPNSNVMSFSEDDIQPTIDEIKDIDEEPNVELIPVRNENNKQIEKQQQQQHIAGTGVNDNDKAVITEKVEPDDKDCHQDSDDDILAFSDDDDDDNDPNKQTDFLQITAKYGNELNKINERSLDIEEFQQVDDISVAIFKQGTTPKRDCKTRSRFTSSSTSNKQQLSPAVTNLRTPSKKARVGEQQPKSSSLSCKGVLRSRRNSSSEQSLPVVSLKKRRANTPVTPSTRKRSRTISCEKSLPQVNYGDPITSTEVCNNTRFDDTDDAKVPMDIDDVDEVFEDEQLNPSQASTANEDGVDSRLDELEAILSSGSDMPLIQRKEEHVEYNNDQTLVDEKCPEIETHSLPECTPPIIRKARSRSRRSDSERSGVSCDDDGVSRKLEELEIVLHFGQSMFDRIKNERRSSKASSHSSSRSTSPAVVTKKRIKSEKNNKISHDETKKNDFFNEIPKPRLPTRTSPRKRDRKESQWVSSSPGHPDDLKLTLTKMKKKKFSPFEKPKTVHKSTAIVDDFEHDRDFQSNNQSLNETLMSSANKKSSSSKRKKAQHKLKRSKDQSESMVDDDSSFSSNSTNRRLKTAVSKGTYDTEGLENEIPIRHNQRNSGKRTCTLQDVSYDDDSVFNEIFEENHNNYVVSSKPSRKSKSAVSKKIIHSLDSSESNPNRRKRDRKCKSETMEGLYRDSSLSDFDDLDIELGGMEKRTGRKCKELARETYRESVYDFDDDMDNFVEAHKFRSKRKKSPL